MSIASEKKQKGRTAEILSVLAKHNFYSAGFTPGELRTTLEDLDSFNVKLGQIVVGVVFAVLGILVFTNNGIISKYLPAFYGFILVVSGLSSLIPAWKTRSEGGFKWALIAGLIVVVLGIILITHPGYAQKMLGIYFGLGLVIRGITGIAEFVKTRK